MNGSFMFFGDVLVPAPGSADVVRRGWNIVEDAYAHAVWDEQWRALTGRSWAQWQADRYQPPVYAQLEVELDRKTSRLSSARVVSPGVLPLTRFRTKSAMGAQPMVSMRMSMHHVKVTTKAAS